MNTAMFRLGSQRHLICDFGHAASSGTRQGVDLVKISCLLMYSPHSGYLLSSIVVVTFCNLRVTERAL